MLCFLEGKSGRKKWKPFVLVHILDNFVKILSKIFKNLGPRLWTEQVADWHWIYERKTCRFLWTHVIYTLLSCYVSLSVHEFLHPNEIIWMLWSLTSGSVIVSGVEFLWLLNGVDWGACTRVEKNMQMQRVWPMHKSV